MRLICVYIAAFLAVFPAGAEVSVKAVLSPPDIPIFRTATYTVEIEAPTGTSAPLVELSGKITNADPALTAKDLQVSSNPIETDPAGEGRERIRVSFTLDALSPGAYVVPKLPIEVAGEKFDLPSLTLRVHDLTEAEKTQVTQFVDIGDPALIAPPQRSLWFYVFIALLLLGGIGALLWYLRQRGAKEVWTPPAPKPWQVAHKRLEELAQRRLPQQGRFEPYYVDLSAILRYYIEDRFHLRAPERTTPEFLDEASRAGVLLETQQAMLARFLRHCDRVKFARYEPSFEEMENGFESVRQFVVETTPPTTQQDAEQKEAA